MIDLLTVPEEQEIADNIAGFLSAKFPVARHRARAGAIAVRDPDRWIELAQMGALGIAFPESLGGLGLGIAEETLAFREFGRFLVTPAVLGAVLGARIAVQAGRVDLAKSIISGEEPVGIAHAVGCAVHASLNGDYQLFDSPPTGYVVAWGDEGAGIYEVDRFTSRVAVAGLDQSVLLQLARGDDVAASHWVDSTDAPVTLIATVLSAAMLVGISEAVRDMAVGYAKTRVQFGKPIGSFQAIKHKCADMALHAEAAWCETVYAALALRAGHVDAAFHAANSKMIAATAALASAKDNVQVHGGMGYTAEIDAHFFVKRAHVLNEIGGNVRRMQQKLLELPLGE